ncbi:MAG: 4-hydroxythreonine-4-phosphate dehydrogenase PdxA [Hydrogenobacter sp.]|uniref:4-hydroxythreonine-4-phosphate dehydrogenase PdxA n=1 Tax=Hydrogenobacter thermophilus TaxID=940 RepID=UPI0030FCDCB2
MLKIGITIGDPAGVGPELIIKLLDHVDPKKAYIIYGERKILESAKKLLEKDINMKEIHTTDEVKVPGIYIADLDISETDRPMPSLTSGKVAIAYLGRAVVDAVIGNIHGLLTMPINKFWAKLAGFSYEGQTEFLAQASNVREYAMLMYSEKIKVVLLSTHLPLKVAIEKVSRESVKGKVELAHREFKRLFGYEPSIGVVGLNPHAGEMGQIGREDVEEILPAIEELKGKGIKVEGPLSPDSAFLKTDAFDVFLCMYHDQGLIPFKLLAFRDGVNLTLGIPFVRTSPDHGTAYDIAWKGIVDMSSALHALRLCEKLVERITSFPAF